MHSMESPILPKTYRIVPVLVLLFTLFNSNGFAQFTLDRYHTAELIVNNHVLFYEIIELNYHSDGSIDSTYIERLHFNKAGQLTRNERLQENGEYQTVYDSLGRICYETSYFPEINHIEKDTFYYVNDVLIKEEKIRPDGSKSMITEYTYQGDSLQITTVTFVGREKKPTYIDYFNDKKQLIETNINNRVKYMYHYDEWSNLIEFILINLDDLQPHRTVFKYSGKNRIEQVIYATSGNCSSAYKMIYNNQTGLIEAQYSYDSYSACEKMDQSTENMNHTVFKYTYW